VHVARLLQERHNSKIVTTVLLAKIENIKKKKNIFLFLYELLRQNYISKLMLQNFHDLNLNFYIGTFSEKFLSCVVILNELYIYIYIYIK